MFVSTTVKYLQFIFTHLECKRLRFFSSTVCDCWIVDWKKHLTQNRIKGLSLAWAFHVSLLRNSTRTNKYQTCLKFTIPPQAATDGSPAVANEKEQPNIGYFYSTCLIKHLFRLSHNVTHIQHIIIVKQIRKTSQWRRSSSTLVFLLASRKRTEQATFSKLKWSFCLCSPKNWERLNVIRCVASIKLCVSSSFIYLLVGSARRRHSAQPKPSPARSLIRRLKRVPCTPLHKNTKLGSNQNK